MNLFENKDYLLTLSVPLTIVVLIVSIVYSLRNILRIWKAGSPQNDEQRLVTRTKAGDDEQEDSDKENKNTEKPAVNTMVDPMQYCEHIQSEVKKARHRVATKEIRQNLSAEELEKEREIQRKQIEQIFKLMEQNSDKFGLTSEDDVRQQMKLYV